MKIQPYNKNFSSKREERGNQGVKLLETNCEQKDEAKKWKKKNTGCKTVIKYKNSNTVQFSGTNKVVNNEQVNNKEIKCNLTTQSVRPYGAI